MKSSIVRLSPEKLAAFSDSPRAKADQSVSTAAASSESASIVALGVTVATRADRGAEIVGLSPGGVAELANLRVGDLINSIDGKPVRTSLELVTELSNHAAGSKIRLGYMFRTAITYYQKEMVVILGGNH